MYPFFRFLYAHFQKRQQDLNLLQRFSIPIELFTEDWIVDWAVLAQIVEYSMHPILLKILFYANLPFKWILLWCLFLLSNFFFFQKSLCWERKWWGGVKDKDLTDFALIKLPPNSQFSLPCLEHGYDPFMRWPSYIIVVLPVDLVFRRVRISIINQRKWMFLWIWLL